MEMHGNCSGHGHGAGAESASGLPSRSLSNGASRSSPGAPAPPASAPSQSQSQLDQQLDLDLKLESLTLDTETETETYTTTWNSSNQSSHYSAYTHHQATRQSLLSLQYSEHAHAVLTLNSDSRHPYQAHGRSQSHAELPLNPISIEPSLPPSLTTTPDSPIAHSVPLPAVEDVFSSRPCSPWRSEFPTPGADGAPHCPSQPSAGHEHCCEPVYRNRLLDMVRDEFGSALELDDAASVHSGSTHGLDLDGMSRTASRAASRSVSRSNTIRSTRSAVSRASTSRGISPQPTIVLSLEGSDEEMLHEGTEDTGATGAQRSFRPLGNGDGDSVDGGENGAAEVAAEEEAASPAPEASEAGEDNEAQPEAPEATDACTHVPAVLGVAALRSLALPASWPRVSLVSPEQLVIDRRVTSTVPVDPEDFGGMVPLDVPEFQLGDATIDLAAAGSSLGSTLGSSVGSVCSRISRDRKGSNETAITCSSIISNVCPAPTCAGATSGGAAGTAANGNAATQQLFGREFAARLMLELYRASLLKSPIASPLNSPSQSPSTGTATAWWGGGLSVRAAAREVLRDDVELPSDSLLSQPQSHAAYREANGAPNGGLGLGFDQSEVQEVILPDSDGSNCSTPIAAAAPRNRPQVTSSGFRLEGKAFEFDPPFSASECDLLTRELSDLIAREAIETGYHPHYPPHYGSPDTVNGEVYAPCELSARLADPRAASLGPLAPELATTRPSTPPDTPTVGCAPLPTLTAPVTPIQTRPSSPTVFQKAVAINAALQQLARNSGAPSPLSGISVTNERPSRLEEMRRQSLRAAGIVSPGSTAPASGAASPGVSQARRKSLEWAKMTPRSSGEYARDIFGGLLREAPSASVSQPSSPEFLKRKLGGAAGEWDLSTTESAPGSPKSSRRNTLSGLGLFLSRARTKQK